MSKLLFKKDEYSLKELLDLKNKSPLYKKGDVIDLETGEICDIEDIDKLKTLYFQEIIPSKELEKAYSKVSNVKLKKELEDKFKKDLINKEELAELITLVRFDNRSKFEVNFKEFFMVNAKKDKPKDISISDYGRFMLLLDMMSRNNTLKNKHNGKKIKESDILMKLEVKTEKSLKNLFSRLSKCKMMARTGYGEKRFIHINPVYAHRKIRIDQTLYDLFKEDLNDFLSEYEIRYFEMSYDNEDSSATIEITRD